MPLSEEEERVLAEIERHLHESDPDLVETVSATTVYTHAGSRLRWAIFAMVVGFVLMVATFTISWIPALAGFLIMLGGAVGAEQNIRRLGKAGWADLSARFRKGDLRATLEARQRRARGRFSRRSDGE